MSALMTTLLEVFTSITANVGTVLNLYTTTLILQLSLALMVSGAIFSFARRLLHRR